MSGNTKEETEQQFVSEAPVEEENGKNERFSVENWRFLSR